MTMKTTIIKMTIIGERKIETEIVRPKEGENNSETTRLWLPKTWLDEKVTTSSKMRMWRLIMKMSQYKIRMYRTDAMKNNSTMPRISATRPPTAIRTISKLRSNLGKVLARFAHWSRQAERKCTKRICHQTPNYMIEADKRARLIIQIQPLTVKMEWGHKTCSQSLRTTSLT